MLGLKRKAAGGSSELQETEEAASSLQLLASISKRPRASKVLKAEAFVPSPAAITNPNPNPSGMTREMPRKDEYRVLANCPRWRSWPHIEEVFLIGAVMERFFTRGSLSSSKKKEDGEHCWTSIKNIYDHAWKTHLSRTGDTREFLCRSANALARHYKVMKERIMHNQYSENRDFRQFYFEWETKYNKDNVLLVGCEDVVPVNCGKRAAAVRQTPTAEHTLGNHKFDDDLSELPKSRWSYEEEVFLVAAVLERFFQRGSLASTRMDIGSNECWTSIKQTYDYIKGRYHQVYGGAVQGKFARVKRSARALTRHFKVMKVRFTESGGHDNLKKYYMDWKAKYNVNGSILSYDGKRKQTMEDSAQPQSNATSQANAAPQHGTGQQHVPSPQQQIQHIPTQTQPQPQAMANPSSPMNMHNPMMAAQPMWYLAPQNAAAMGMMPFQALQLQQFGLQQPQAQQQPQSAQQTSPQQTSPMHLKVEQPGSVQLQPQQQQQMTPQLQRVAQPQVVKQYSPQAVANFYNLSTLANMLNRPSGPTQVAT